MGRGIQRPAQGASGRHHQGRGGECHTLDAAARAHFHPAQSGFRHRSWPVGLGACDTVTGITPYISTGALQVATAIKLLDGETNKVGFASACKAMGHRYLLGFLEQRGLARASVQNL